MIGMPRRSSRHPRQKSCQNCSKAKVRCDLVRPICGRCVSRGRECIYVGSGDGEPVGNGATFTATIGLNNETPSDSTPSVRYVQRSPVSIRAQTQDQQDQLQSLDFSNLCLYPAIDEWRIRSRWMESLLPSEGEILKNLSPTVVNFSREILKSYPKEFQDGRPPPFLHPAQLAQQSTALTNVATITRMWDSRSESLSALMRSTIQQEVTRLVHERASNNHFEQVAGLQAFLIYAILLLLCDDGVEAYSNILVQLQEMTADVAGLGVLCEGEIARTPPDWESWILASAKRRTIFASYMFDNVVSFTTGLSAVVAIELDSLPVPVSKRLWEALDRQLWTKEYIRYLAEWEDGELVIGELRHPPQLNKAIQAERIRRWLTDVDDFGMMHFAVTTMVYRSG